MKFARRDTNAFRFPRHGFLAITLFAAHIAAAQPVVLSAAPDADAFIRSLAPSNNYGMGGALSVSGSAAVNGSGQQNGLFDALMRFSLSNTIASLDNAFGTQNWAITGVRLVVNEMASPDNSIFNRGVGAFEVQWLSSDAWVEGTGKPNAPTTDGVTWEDLSSLVNSNRDSSLGFFTNAGTDGPINFDLQLVENFLSDIRQGEEVSLRLTAASPEVGFTFNSRNFGNTNLQPVLEIAAAADPRPRIDSITFVDGNIFIRFAATSNWTYRLQRAYALGFPKANWLDVLTLPAQPSSSNILYSDGATNSAAVYRLSLSP